MELSVVTIHHDDARRSERSVRATSAALDALEVDAEILLVDNGPTGEVEQLERMERVTVLRSPRRQGFGANANLGISAAGAPLVLLLNDDAEITAPCLASMLEAIRTSNATVCVPRVLAPNGAALASAWRFLTLPGVVAFVLGPTRPPYTQSNGARSRSVEAVSAGVMLMRRRPILELGGFDAGYFMYCEDMDLCRRLASAGHERLYVPNAEAVHGVQSSTAAHPAERDREVWRSRHRFWSKHCGPAERRAIRAILAFAYLCAAGLARARRRPEESARYRRFASYACRPPRDGGLSELAAGWRSR
jgi:N-acetylglucosaminyl-diphospho-decaprenol L-rhamnosyltransferase